MRLDLTDKRFGRLVATKYVGLTPTRQAVWLAACDCGREVVVRARELVSGDTQSCGCLKAEATAARNREMGKHWASRSPTYKSWRAMRDRCLNPKSKDYPRYGGRGISITPAWDTFENFLADMGERPPGMTLERIDVNGNYEPGNVRWGTPAEQAMNRRSSRVIEFNGIADTVTGWARRIGITQRALENRLYRAGWPIERALTLPARRA